MPVLLSEELGVGRYHIYLPNTLITHARREHTAPKEHPHTITAYVLKLYVSLCPSIQIIAPALALHQHYAE
jgi:hypothetical protein